MAIVGNKTDNKELLRGFEQDPMHETVSKFVDVTSAAKQESGCDLYERPTDFLRNSISRDALRKYFLEESYCPEDPKFKNNQRAVKEHLENMEALFENDCEGISEAASGLGGFSPVVGMALPMHKNILMNASFEQVMPKDVARSPKFTLTMETRNLVDTKGNVIDMYAEQNLIKKAVDESVPMVDHLVSVLPEQETTDWLSVVASEGGYTFDKSIANLSIRTEVLSVIVNGVFVKTGEKYYDVATKAEVIATADVTKPVQFMIHAQFTPGYGDHTRQMHHTFMIRFRKDATSYVTASGTILGYLNDQNKMLISTTPLKVNDGTTESFDTTTHTFAGVVVRAVLDVSSAAFPTVQPKWTSTTTPFQIPEAPHITMPVTPEELKDVGAMYDINQVTKYMSMARLVLLHWRDDSIHEKLDDSYRSMPANHQYKCAFDYAPPLNFAGTPIAWRQAQFMDRLERMTTEMLQELNDENMTIAIFGRPDLIRSVAPQQFTFQTPPNIGPIELDFTRTVATSERRVYNFISSQKMRGINGFMVLLIPRNSMRITYKMIDYQMYLSNEIRDTRNFQLPAVTAFDRWLFLQYQPVQGRCAILNPNGLRENPEAEDYIGVNAMNDYASNRETYASEVNGVIDSETGSFKIPPIKTEP